MSFTAPEDAFLDVNDAHLRVYGNVHADGLKLGQLEIVTTTSTGSTIQFLHQHTAFTTTSNIEVGTTNHDLFVDTKNSKVGILTNTPTKALDVNGTVKATAFDGDGALLTGIPSSAINGTLSQWTTVAGPKIHYSDGNVGIGIADPLHTLDVVGDINFTGTLREDGNPFVSTPWTIESGPTALSYTLGNVGVGGTTPSAKLEVTGNAHVSTDLSVGGNLTINTISAAATHGLGAVTALSNTSADTVLLTNTGTSLVASGAVQAVSFTDGTETLTGGAWSGSAATLSTPRTIGGVSFNGSAAIVPTTFGAATFSGDVTVDTNTLHVDSTNNMVGIGTVSPDGPLHISKSAPNNGDTGPGILFTRHSNTYGGCIWNESNNNIDGLYFNAFLATAASTAYGATPKMVINSNGRVGVGIINPRPTFEVFNSGLGTGVRNDTGKIFAVQSDSTSWTDGHCLAGINIKAAVGVNGRFLQCNTGFGSTGASTLDAQFILYEQGTGTAENAWNGGGADYAEYFEWSDGNPDDEDRVGMTVKLNGDKIDLVSDTDDKNSIIGAISGNPGFVGDNAGLKWTGKYLRDDFGRKLMEDYEVYAWKDEKGDDQIHDIKQPIPEDLNIPEDRIVKTARRRVLNPSFDPDVAYVPREERKEWSTVGLVGKLRIRTDQPIHSNWILLRNISDSVGEWLIK